MAEEIIVIPTTVYDVGKCIKKLHGIHITVNPDSKTAAEDGFWHGGFGERYPIAIKGKLQVEITVKEIPED